MKSILPLIAVVVSVLAIPARAAAFDIPPLNKLTLDELTEAVWSYSSRTFGEIDSLTVKSLDRTLQGGNTDVPSSGQVAGVKEELPKLDDRPVVETSADHDQDLTTKLDSTGQTLDELKLNFQHATSDVGLIGLKWDSLAAADVTKSLDDTITLLESDHKLAGLIKSWGWLELGAIASQEVSVKGSLVTVRNIVGTAGMQPEAYTQLKSTLKTLEAIEGQIGEPADATGGATIFGRYKQTQDVVGQWNSQQGQLEQLLRDAASLSQNQLASSTEASRKQVFALNQIAHAEAALDTHPKNKILDLLGLVLANKALLAQDQGETLTRTWLEEGSVVFKTLVTNPSPLGRREVAIRYYLPAEVKEADLLGHDSAVAIQLDADKHQYYVTGNLTVAAGDTRIVLVRTADIWQISPERLASTRQQAAELVQSLANNPRYVHGVTLKSDIEVALNNIAALQSQVQTPEQKISAFRGAAGEWATVDAKLGELQQLVEPGSATTRWQSLVAGVNQPAAAWLVLVVIGLGLLAAAVRVFLPGDAISTAKRRSPWRSKTRAQVRQFRPFSEAIASSDL